MYERTVYNLLDVLTTLGGLFSSLSVIGMSSAKVLGYNLMLSSLIRKLYHFKPRFESEVKKSKKKRAGKKEVQAQEAEPLQQDGDEEDDNDDMRRAYH